MVGPSLDQTLLFIYFVYGLAFFAMGLALGLESLRSPAPGEAGRLAALAAFGVLHGIHEWLEFFLLQATQVGAEVPAFAAHLRLAILACSFAALALYGVLAWRGSAASTKTWSLAVPGVLVAVVVAGLAAAVGRGETLPWSILADALIRYLAAVPGALLAAEGLRARAMMVSEPEDRAAARYLHVAAIGFALYGLSQLVVPRLEMFPANILNTETFRQVTGIPHQVLRAVLAVLITLSLLRAMALVEKRRQFGLQKAQADRLQAVRQQEVLRRDLLRHTVRAQEEERSRIARELHDETAQVLAALSLELAEVRSLSPAREVLLRKLDHLQKLSRDISAGLVRLVHDLRPAQLDDLGLMAALQSLVERDWRPKGLDVSMEVYGVACRLDPLVETVLYRVAQEALSNVARHAGTAKAALSMDFLPAEVRLRISDRGAGFSPGESFSEPRGWGLAGMRERVEAVGGRFELQTEPGMGTIVMAAVPRESQEEGLWKSSV